MNVKKLRYFAFALIAVAFCACQKEPSTSDLHRDYLVYTAHDTGTDFAAIVKSGALQKSVPYP